MQYLLLIYTKEGVHNDFTPQQISELMESYRIVTQQMKDAGVYLGGEALKPTGSATSVRVRDAETTTTDGPFAETTEALGGFYLVDCANLDDALGWAARIPDAAFGTIEVRPVMVYD